nr:hypothetical protein [Candidatus Sigynarchaeota archaeon]
MWNPNQLATAEAAFEHAKETKQASDWDSALQEIEKLISSNYYGAWNAASMMFDSLMHLGRFEDCIKKAMQFLNQAEKDYVFGSCWTAIIASTFFLHGPSRALEAFKDMAGSLLKNEKNVQFIRFSYLEKFANDPAMPRFMKLFCDEPVYAISNAVTVSPKEFIPLSSVYNVLLEVANENRSVFSGSAFDSMVPLKDGESISWDDAIDKTLISPTNTTIRVTNAYLLAKNGSSANHFIYNVNYENISYQHWLASGQMLDCCASGKVNHFERISFWVIETGRQHPAANTPISLQVISPGVSVNTYAPYYRRFRRRSSRPPKLRPLLQKASNSIVPACKKCDSTLLSSFRAPASKSEFNMKQCPYCGNRLKIYWRGAKAYPVQLTGLKTPEMASRYYGNMLEILDDGIKKQVLIHPNEQEALVTEIIKTFGSKGFGPVDIEIHVDKYGYVQVNWSPSTGVPVSTQKSFTWNVTDIPDYLLRKNATMEERIIAGCKEASDKITAWKAKKQKKIDYKAFVKNFPDNIVDFWTKSGFFVESCTVDERRKRLSITVDSIMIHVKGTPKKDNRLFDLVNYLGVAVEEFRFLPVENDLLLSFIEKDIGKTMAKIGLVAVERSIRSYNMSLTPVQKLVPESNPKLVMKRRRKVLACEACSAMYLKYFKRYMPAIDQFSSPTCPYCKVQKSLVERVPRVLQIDFDTAQSAPNASMYRYRRPIHSIGIKYHGLHFDMPINARNKYVLFKGIQAQSKDQRIGPLKIDMTYNMRRIIDPSFTQAKIVAFKPGTAIHPIEWRSTCELPEDKSAF